MATSTAAEPERAAAPESVLPHPTRRNWLWATCQFALRLVFVTWLRYRARGAEKIPTTGGGLVLANHQSSLDPLLVGLPLSRPVSYLARDSLFRLPVLGWVLRNTYVMPISREAASSATIKGAVQRMRHGFLVGIFPEGTRSSDGTVGPFKPGFIALLRRGKVPVYPVGVAGAHEAMPRDRLLLRPRRVTIVFGDPLTPEEIERYSGRGQEDALVALARERVIACQREAEQWRRCSAAGRRPGRPGGSEPDKEDQPA